MEVSFEPLSDSKASAETRAQKGAHELLDLHREEREGETQRLGEE